MRNHGIADMLGETEIEESQLDSDIAISDDDLTIETGEPSIEGIGLETENEGRIVGDEGIEIDDDGIQIEDEGLTNAFIESNRRQSFLPLLKEELRMKIQVKRLSEGKDELQIKVEEPPVYEVCQAQVHKLSLIFKIFQFRCFILIRSINNYTIL